MAALIAGVFAAAILGSLHCAGMCGAFAGFATVPGPGRTSRPLSLQLAYHGGRLGVYVALGALAGALGAGLDLGGSWLGLRRLAAVSAGAILIISGVRSLLQLAGVGLPSLSAAPLLGVWIRKGHAAALAWPAVLRALAVGLLTALLPCGWLWSFVLAAAGTGRPLLGAMMLAAFWAGTVPILAALGGGLQQIAARTGMRVQLLTSLVIIALGMVTLSQRWHLAAGGNWAATAGPPCHDAP